MRHRPTLDLIVLMLAGTVCLAILASGATIAALEWRDPDIDTTAAAEVLQVTITTILGVLLGLITGRAQGRSEQLGQAPDPHDLTPTDPATPGNV